MTGPLLQARLGQRLRKHAGALSDESEDVQVESHQPDVPAGTIGSTSLEGYFGP